MAKPEKSGPAQTWIGTIALYEREFKKWEGRVEKILKRYRDEQRIARDSGSHFNILWSNVQTAIPAVFSRIPKPDVSRRFRDNDPVGRVAALLLERALEFDAEHYSDFRSAMKACVQDRFLGGRGVAWCRYEPHTKKVQTVPDDGAQVTEDTDEAETEQLENETAPADYVHWKDFGHTVARTWEEVTAVWRKVYMGRQALLERFGEEDGKRIPLDTKPDDLKKNAGSDQVYEAVIYEIWDKANSQALWLSKSLGEIIDTRDVAKDPDLPKFDNFWPCAKPLYATLTNDSLVPVPDFSLYQDQANTLDVISDRIEGLIKALQVKGVYDAGFPELARLFTEGENGTLLGVKNWAAFAEKQGLKGAIDVVDLTPIFNALKACYEAAEEQKQQIYEITGLADIIRGQSDPNETAAAQKMKGSFGSMRLRSMQGDVAQFATELLQLKAQIICNQFTPETIAKIGGAETLNDADKGYIPQALQLLKSATLRDFRIEVVSDSMVYMDEIQEKQDRMEFLSAVSDFMAKAVQVPPELAPLAAEMLKFGVTGFRVGKQLEGSIDQTIDQLKKQAAQPPQDKPDPEIVKIQTQADVDLKKHAAELQQKAQYDQGKAQLDAQLAKAQQDAQAQQDALSQQLEAQRKQQEAQIEQRMRGVELMFEKWKVEQENATKIAVAELSAKSTLAAAQLSAARAEATGGNVQEVASAPVPG